MWKAGHSLIKTKLVELHALLAAEMNGHIFFAGDYHDDDDALNVATWLLRVIGSSGLSPARIRDQLPPKTMTLEIRIACADAQDFAAVREIVDTTLSGAAWHRPRSGQ
jgi:phosphomannomutase